MDKQNLISRFLLICGTLFLVIAFIHILTTPIVGKWLVRDVTTETLSYLTPSALINQLVGILLIPFGISTLYCAMGVRVGQHFTRIIAIINSAVVIIIPILILILMGPQYLNSALILIADVFMAILGVTMFLVLLWM